MLTRRATTRTASGKAIDARTSNFYPARADMSQAQIGAKSETEARELESFVIEAKATRSDEECK